MTEFAVESIAAAVTLGDDGIWRAAGEPDVSYPESGHSACLAVEEGSFWFNHRNDCIRALVSAFPPRPGKPILDVGGGNGYVALGLTRAGYDVVLIEPGSAGATNARNRGVEHVICATTRTASVRAGTVGAIGLFDVIEHIDDDRGFMSDMSSLLDLGDRVYATVPAYQSLWSADDVRAGHHRRYRREEISSLFESAGLEVDFATYFFRPLPVPVAIVRTLPHRVRAATGKTVATAADDGNHHQERRSSTARSHAAAGTTVSDIARRLLRREVANIAQQRPMRFGGSILITAHRR